MFILDARKTAKTQKQVFFLSQKFYHSQIVYKFTQKRKVITN